MAMSAAGGSQATSSPAQGGGSENDASPFAPPQITLPKGGGAIRGIDEKFAANLATGAGSLSIGLALSPARMGFGPKLSLGYDSGAGNGVFGMGWSLSTPSITRRTDKGTPRYFDGEESDIFVLSGAEDLVPVLSSERGGTGYDAFERHGYLVKRYRPRIEGLFALIERWTRLDTGEAHWRSLSKDNVLTVYGLDASARIADPEAPRRVFSWLISRSYDDKGNAVLYDYVPEDDRGVDPTKPGELNRSRTANRYLKRIRYGNRTPLLLDPERPSFRRCHLEAHGIEAAQWMFEAVFDYGEGHYREEKSDADGRIFSNAVAVARGDWPIRRDPFSSYRSSFEVRTYRLCRRVLMFHHFPAELETESCLVRSTALHYDEKPTGSVLARVVQSGHKRIEDGRYLTRSLPAMDLAYSRSPLEDADFSDYRIEEAAAAGLANLPGGIDGGQYRWIDLDGEGISGVLSEQARSWFYKPNLGAGRFGPTEEIGALPSGAALSDGTQQLMDLAGDGNLDLVDLSGPAPGFYERTPEAEWSGFRSFRSLPVRDWSDPNLRFVDLTGDGVADVLVTEDDAFTWHPSLLHEGFGAAVRVAAPLEEGMGPRVVFADGTQSIYLADMCGDGLTDIVRIRNGEVCYWPNLGYGRFGPKVTMDGSPWFDEPDQFEEERVRLADTDGSGATDILYLARDGVKIFLNESGNGWSGVRRLGNFPAIDDAASIMVTDFLGRGTACVVWSSPLPSDLGRQLRYVDLMRGQKPHLLVRTDNNLGAETRITYASSTEFYLADKTAGAPWVTRLPFPVHVVARIETYDYVSRNRFVTRYTYHHGYYDGLEREFRGFGRVDQLDTEEFGSLTASGSFPVGENVSATSNVPPVLTKTWLHTGVYLQGGRISRHLAHEYYSEGSRRHREAPLSFEQSQAMLLDDTTLPAHLTPEEAREACRSLKGSTLRQEVYALDGQEKCSRPYIVSESNLTIRLLQHRWTNRHAVFFTHAREAVTFHYERELYDIDGRRCADPRVSHAVTLAVDDYGDVLQSVAIGYGRRFCDPSPLLSDADRAIQARILATLTETEYTNAVHGADAYRTPLPAESRTYELLQLRPDASQTAVTNLFRFDELQAKVRAASDGRHDVPYEDLGAAGLRPGHPYRREIERARNLYRPNDLGTAAGDRNALLPIGKVESRALLGNAYKLAFTPGLVAQVYRRDGEALLPAPADVLGRAGPAGGGYLDLDGDGSWWIPSGRLYFHADPHATPQQELAEALRHFYAPRRFVDPFRNAATIDYDPYDLLVARTTDALGNTATALNDYRVLQPALLTDPNGNRSATRFDALGLVAGAAVMGKVTENLGDSLDGLAADHTLKQIDDFFDAADPHTRAHALLRNATTRIVYDVDRFARSRDANPTDPSQWQPSYAATLARETHAADPPPPGGLKIQIRFSYSDGFGREIQRKIQSEPGPVTDDGPIADPRWTGSGWTIFNNKGKPVRQYEPFFTASHAFQFDMRAGVSPVLFYDPIERVVATHLPNNTYEKVVFDPWRRTTYDVNDTVIFDPGTDPDVGAFFQKLPVADYLPTWYRQRINGALGPDEQDAAAKAARHADTPAVAQFDSLGRTFLAIADNGKGANGSDQKYVTRTVLDIEGHQRAVIDALGRTVMRYDYDVLGACIHQTSMEAGERWMLNDVAGKPIRSWNSRKYAFSTEYDALRRPVRSLVQGGDPSEPDAKVYSKRIVYERTIYGDSVETGLTEAQQQQANAKTKVFKHFDGAGVVTSDLYDFKGNLLRGGRQFTRDYKNAPDWSQDPALDSETFAGATAYDALNRPIALTTPDNSIYRPTYDEANLLKKVDVILRGASAGTAFVGNIDYNAKAQRTRIEYGNGAKTDYSYDALTFRLIALKTTRAAGRNGTAAQIFKDEGVVQDLNHTYDPAGNITRIADAALITVFNGQQVDPVGDYAFDPLYRLTDAKGREHVGQSAFAFAPPDGNYRDFPFVGASVLNDLQQLRNYTERYGYDPVGNFQKMAHGTGHGAGNWTRTYAYHETSQLEPARNSNRLSQTALQTGSNPPVEAYRYDGHGNMVQMPHLPSMQWNFKDELFATSQQVLNAGTPEATYYVYDVGGQRARKITEGQNGSKKNERFYVGGFEIYREYGSGASVSLERDTLHVMDDKQRIALVETQTVANGAAVSSPAPAQRYQFANHLGSACLELDESGGLISYEEYSPYGSTTFEAGRSAAEVSLKRYRYTGMERDEENGFTYHGARYYAPWLGRWTTADPVGIGAGINLFLFSHNSPIVYSDPSGTTPTPDETRELLKQIQQLFRKNLALVASIFDDPRHIGTYAAWLTEGAIKDIFGASAAGNIPYGGSSRVSVDVKIPGTNAAVDLKKSEKALRPSQSIRQTATAQGNEEILAKVMPTKLKVENYSGDLTKAERAATSNAAQDIRDWTAAAPARKALALAGTKPRGGGGSGQRGSASVGLIATLATIASIYLILANSPDARSFAKTTAGTVLVEQAVEKATLAAVGAKGATRVVGFAAGFALSLCGDQSGACDAQESEEAINKRIQEEFPDAYTGRHCTLWGALCIVAETSGSFGPGYQEARATVIQEFNAEYKAEQERSKAEKAKIEECSALSGAGAGSYSTPDPALEKYCR